MIIVFNCVTLTLSASVCTSKKMRSNGVSLGFAARIKWLHVCKGHLAQFPASGSAPHTWYEQSWDHTSSFMFFTLTMNYAGLRVLLWTLLHVGDFWNLGRNICNNNYHHKQLVVPASRKLVLGARSVLWWDTLLRGRNCRARVYKTRVDSQSQMKRL